MTDEPAVIDWESIAKGLAIQVTVLEKEVKRLKGIREENANVRNANSQGVRKEILGYLNEKADKNFKGASVKTQRCINARLAEGYTLEDFKKVVDNKVSQWKGDLAWDRFLRPETLFGNKFDGYLNEKPVGGGDAHSRTSFIEEL